MSNPSRARLSRKLTVSVAIVIGVSVAAMTVSRSDSDAQTTKGEYKLIEAIDVQGECWEDRVGQHDKYAGQIVRYQSIETGKISTYGFLFRPWSAEQAMDEVAHPTVYHTAAIMEFDDLDIDTNQPKWAIHGVSNSRENAPGLNSTCNVDVVKRGMEVMSAPPNSLTPRGALLASGAAIGHKSMRDAPPESRAWINSHVVANMPRGDRGDIFAPVGRYPYSSPTISGAALAIT